MTGVGTRADDRDAERARWSPGEGLLPRLTAPDAARRARRKAARLWGHMRYQMSLRAYAPRSTLVLPATEVPRPRYPAIDAHNHLGQLVPWASFSGDWPRRPVAEMLDVLDAAGVRAVVDLDGGWGEQLRRELARYAEPYPDRFIVFAGLDYDAFARERAIGEYLAHQLRDSARAGARGLKVWKLLGLELRDGKGQLYAVNDRRLDDLWAAAGELHLPVMIHVGDPPAFFQPLDRHNERWEELRWATDCRYARRDVPPLERLLEQLAEVIARHPATTFIGAHVGCCAQNLAWVSQLLDACPNVYVDIGACLGELGRQPFSARDFCLRYADRVLFGTDTAPDRAAYARYYRFLETRDEYFSYSDTEAPHQGRWAIYGIDLPDDVLRRIYFGNAARVLGYATGGTSTE